ncbi:MAG: hypothetical protein AAF208_05175 [Cyanobacteria bacterium P01_A01_bin.45]
MLLTIAYLCDSYLNIEKILQLNFSINMNDVKVCLLIPILTAIIFSFCQLLNNWLAHRQQNQQLLIFENQIQDYQIQIIRLVGIERKTHDLVEFNYELGHSIAALHIQLQATQKLWQVNPLQAEKSLSEAYHISGYLMHEIRKNIRLMGEDNDDSLTTCRRPEFSQSGSQSNIELRV